MLRPVGDRNDDLEIITCICGLQFMQFFQNSKSILVTFDIFMTRYLLPDLTFQFYYLFFIESDYPVDSIVISRT